MYPAKKSILSDWVEHSKQKKESGVSGFLCSHRLERIQDKNGNRIVVSSFRFLCILPFGSFPYNPMAQGYLFQDIERLVLKSGEIRWKKFKMKLIEYSLVRIHCRILLYWNITCPYQCFCIVFPYRKNQQLVIKLLNNKILLLIMSIQLFSKLFS